MPDMKKNIWSGKESDIFVAVGVVIVIAMMIVPMPTPLLDTFMALNLTLSLVVILIVLYTKKTTDFSIFPTLLLLTTVFGLGLNISSTRLILSQGEKFNGKLVRAFAHFVVGGSERSSLLIGVIIFIILIAVQIIVITKGATRVAEVAARFTLDGMVQKNMSIDTEVASGALTEEEGMEKRLNLQKEVDFYAAMDGASKFVSGNVKVGILITAINIVGGMIVGTVFRKESLSSALENYVSLTVGDGLVSQFPALLISTATAIIVTRAISTGSFGSDVADQFSREAKVYWIAGFFLFILAFLPGFPWYVLIPMAAVMGYAGFRIKNKNKGKEDAEQSERKRERSEESVSELPAIVPLDPLSLELGYGLIPLVDKEKGAELLDRITRIGSEAAIDLGLMVPKIRIRDNMRLGPSEYCVKIRGVEVGKAVIRTNHFLAINSAGITGTVAGEKTTDPAFGLPALWISPSDREKAEEEGYMVVDPPSIIATHLTGIIRKNAAEILGRQEAKTVIDSVKERYPAVADDVLKNLSIGEIHKVLQNLLKEQVSIRDIVTILETLGDYAGISKDIVLLTEKTRQALKRQISLQYADENKELYVITIDPDIEKKIIDSRVDSIDGCFPELDSDFMRKWINGITNLMLDLKDSGKHIVLLCMEEARPLVRASIAREFPDLPVMSVMELSQDIKPEFKGQINF